MPIHAPEVSLALRRPLARSLRIGHPWIYRDALAGDAPEPGTRVAIVDRRGRVLARGLADAGPIAVRVFMSGDAEWPADLFTRRIRAALDLRRKVVPPKTDAFRLIHGEGDRLPGLVCDIYGSCAVIALDGEAVRARFDELHAALRPTLTELGVVTVLRRQGRRGERTVDRIAGPEPAAPLVVHEQDLALVADLRHGQKTGLFLDQRTSRARVRRLAKGRRVLDLYAYVGGFSAAAGRGGAKEVTTVDVAEPAIAMAQHTWRENGLPEDRHTLVAADVTRWLPQVAETEQRFDLVIADPPSFAPKASAREAALGAYEALFADCLRVLAPGGWLLAASCSSHIDRLAFENTLAEASARTSRVLQIVDRWGAPADHPRLLAFPEGDYLKVTVVRALEA